MSVIFWSYLRDLSVQFNTQYLLLCEGFLSFFSEKWKPFLGEDQFFRAVDQALALLVCLRMLKVFKEGDLKHIENGRLYLQNLIKTTRTIILSDFNFKDPLRLQNYIGTKPHSRIAWHEIWVQIALFLSSTTSHDIQLSCKLLVDFEEYFIFEDLVCAENVSSNSNKVFYTNDCCMFYALYKTCTYCGVEQVNTPGKNTLEACLKQMKSENGLLHESNIHQTIPLHAQSECLFALTFDPSDFVEHSYK